MRTNPSAVRGRRLLVVVVPGVAAAMLVACGSSGGTPSGGAGTPTSAPASASASSSSPQSPSSEQSPSSAAPSETAQTTAHAAEKGEPALYAVPGYELVDVPASANLGKALAKGMNSSTPGMARGSSTHAILMNGAQVALLTEVTIAPRYADQKSIMLAATKEGAKAFAGDGAETTTTRLHSEKVVVSSSEGTDNMLVFGWVHDGVMTYVIGSFSQADRDLGSVLETQFVNGYLEAAHA